MKNIKASVRIKRQAIVLLISLICVTYADADETYFNKDLGLGHRNSDNDVGFGGDAQWMADVNGDGRADYVYNRKNKREYWVMLAKNPGDGFEADAKWGSRDSDNNVGFGGDAQWMADVNGDGKADYVYNRNKTREYWVMLAKNSGDGFETDKRWGSRDSDNNVGFGGDAQWMADVNGDGRADYVYNRKNKSEYWVMLAKSSVDEFETDKRWGSRDSDNDVGFGGDAQWMADVNGDGRADYVYNRKNKSEYWVMLAKNSGDGFETDKRWGSRDSDNDVGFGGDAQWMADVNGDGRADYVYNRNKTHEYWVMLAKSSVDEFETDAYLGSRDSDNDVGFGGDAQWMADVNGDGRADYVYNRKNKSEYWVMFTKNRSPTSVTMIIAADPQFFWGDEQISEYTNIAQINAMNNFLIPTNRLSWPSALPQGGGTLVEKPVGVIINGDLTAFFHGNEVSAYKNCFQDKLNYLIFPGLGNHDYANNVEDCANNGCAKDAISYISNTLTKDNIDYFNQSLVNSYDLNSLAYSFKIGMFNFFQLHYKPSYSNESGIDISCSLQWLEQELQAMPDGEKAIINVHDSDGALGDSCCQLYGKKGTKLGPNDNNTDSFIEIVQSYESKIIGIFAGHIHSSYGYIDNASDTSIPIFRSGAPIGSSEKTNQVMTFLLVNFTETYMNVGVIHYNSNGVPAFFTNTTGDYLNTYLY